MEGRWPSLAVSAHLHRSLDYSKISRDSSESLLLERLILDRLEDGYQAASGIVTLLGDAAIDLARLAKNPQVNCIRPAYMDVLGLLLPWEKDALQQQTWGAFSGNVERYRELYRAAEAEMLRTESAGKPGKT